MAAPIDCSMYAERRCTVAGLDHCGRLPRQRFSAIALVWLAGYIGFVGFAAGASNPGQPNNIIILLADGVAATQLEIAGYASRHLRDQPFTITDTIFEEGAVGLMTTHAHEAIVTDSAAAGSAMSTGVKTTIGTIAISPDWGAVRTAMEAAKARGKRIGLVTTATVYDATPAAFSVHARTHRDAQAVVDQYLALEPDVLLGGGSDYFLPVGTLGGKRNDGKDVMAAFRAKGYRIAGNVRELRVAIGPRLLGLFAEGDMRHEIDRDVTREPSIAEMAEVAIRVLSQESPHGFVLLLETENTDTAGHRNDLAALIGDLWAFDRAVQLARAFQRQAPAETLIIMTGDHETGGLRSTYTLNNPRDTSSQNGLYGGPVHLDLIHRITRSIEQTVVTLGKKLSPKDLDKLVAERFTRFHPGAAVREAFLMQQLLARPISSATKSALTREGSRQTGFSWGTSGHTATPVVVGALGPKGELFKGALDNTDFGKILHRLIEGR